MPGLLLSDFVFLPGLGLIRLGPLLDLVLLPVLLLPCGVGVAHYHVSLGDFLVEVTTDIQDFLFLIALGALLLGVCLSFSCSWGSLLTPLSAILRCSLFG